MQEHITGASPFLPSIWHGLKPLAFHHDLEGSPLHGVVEAGLCPSRFALMPSAMAMSAVPPSGGTAYSPTLFNLRSMHPSPLPLTLFRSILIMHQHVKGLSC